MKLWLLAALALPLLCTPALAQQEEPPGTVGHGIICDTFRQLKRFVSIVNDGEDADEAIRGVNQEAENPIACGIVHVIYTVVTPVERVMVQGELVSIVEIRVCRDRRWF